MCRNVNRAVKRTYKRRQRRCRWKGKDVRALFIGAGDDAPVGGTGGPCRLSSLVNVTSNVTDAGFNETKHWLIDHEWLSQEPVTELSDEKLHTSPHVLCHVTIARRKTPFRERETHTHTHALSRRTPLPPSHSHHHLR